MAHGGGSPPEGFGQPPEAKSTVSQQSGRGFVGARTLSGAQVTAAAGGSSPRTWQSLAIENRAKLQGMEPRGSYMESAIRPLGTLGSPAWLFHCKWQAGGLATCPAAAAGAWSPRLWLFGASAHRAESLLNA